MPKIYIYLVRTNSLLSRAIARVTGDLYTHCGIAFAPDLKAVYSFGRKVPKVFWKAGLVRENLAAKPHLLYQNSPCCLLEVEVGAADLRTIKQRLRLFCQRSSSFRYNLAGLFAANAGIRLERQNHYFCSQFLANLFQGTGLFARSPALTKPSDFIGMPNSQILYAGLMDYRTLQKLPAVRMHYQLAAFADQLESFLHSTLMGPSGQPS